ncbi:MAG: hypothetical protein ABI193_11110 [Minicystis sp.]
MRDCLMHAGPGDTVTFDPIVFDPANSDAATTIDVLAELPALDGLSHVRQRSTKK